MKKVKLSLRWTAWLVVLIFTAVLIVGCSAGDSREISTPDPTDTADTVEPENDPKLDKSEYYEIILYLDAGDARAEELKDQNYFRKVLKEKFNFGFEEVIYPGDYNERLALMLSAGDYPDLLRIPDTRYLRSYVQADALYDLEPLIEKYGSNLQARHEERMPYWKMMSGMDDGKIWFYTFNEPSYTTGISGALNEWKIRSDVLEQQKYPRVLTEEDVYKIIKKGVEDNPTTNGAPTVGFSHPLASWGTNGLLCLTYATNMGRLTHMTRRFDSIYDPDQDKFIDVASEYSYRDGLAFFNRLYREGLYDRDAITDNYETFGEKMQQGRAIATYFYNWDWNNWNTKLNKTGQDFRYVPFPGMMTSQIEQGESKIYPITAGEIWSSISMTKNAKYPERLMEVIDWAMSDEGMIAAGWGEEGVQYTVENGRRVPTPEHFEKTQSDPDYKYTWVGNAMFGLFDGLDDNGQPFRMSADADYVAATMDPIVLDVFAQYGWSNFYDQHYKNDDFNFVPDYFVGTTGFAPTYDDQQLRDLERIDMATHDYTMRLVTASSVEEFEKIYKEMLEKRDDMGLAKFIEMRNQEYLQLQEKYDLD